MKRRSIAVLVVLVSVSFIVGTSYAKPVAPNFKVGILLASSGPLWFTSAFQRAAAELAAVDFKETSKITYIYQDAGDSDLEAQLAMERFRASSVNLIIAPLDSESAKRISRINGAKPVPIIAVSALAEATEEPQTKNWFFRLSSTVSQDSSALAEYISGEEPELVVLASDSDSYSKQVSKSLSLGLTFRGIRVRSFNINDYKTIRKTVPDAFVLVSMENSISFMQNMNAWVGTNKQNYLVAGNLANYSGFDWVESLAGARAILPTDQVSVAFKTRLANYMNRPNLLSGQNETMFGLAQRTYDAIRFATGDSAGVRNRLVQLKVDGKNVFDASGYYLAQPYRVYGYKENGNYAPIGLFRPDAP